MRITASEEYVLLNEQASSILNQGAAIVATSATAVSFISTDPDAVNPLPEITRRLNLALDAVTEGLSKGLYRANCISVLTEDFDTLYDTIREVQSTISEDEFETEKWFEKFLVNLVCSVGAFKPIFDKAMNCQCNS